jgi:hypothetical protein
LYHRERAVSIQHSALIDPVSMKCKSLKHGGKE